MSPDIRCTGSGVYGRGVYSDLAIAAIIHGVTEGETILKAGATVSNIRGTPSQDCEISDLFYLSIMRAQVLTSPVSCPIDAL